MRPGSNHVEHRNRLVPSTEGRSVHSRNVLHSKALDADIQVQPASVKVRKAAKNTRELLVWILREQGYTFREIGELLFVTKQRVNQIERKMVLRAQARPRKSGHRLLNRRHNVICYTNQKRIRRITLEEFEARLDAINSHYQVQFDRILERGYKRRRFAKCSSSCETTEFETLWPLIGNYNKKPFSYSKLVSDFPELAKLSHLPQLLCRLRRTSLLMRVGRVKVGTHNLPEVLMKEAPAEQHVAAAIERKVVSWSRKLQQLQSDFRPTRRAGTLDLARQSFLGRLIEDGSPSRKVMRIRLPFD